jgi:hypothetical protein
MSIDEWWHDLNGEGNSEAASENLPKRKRGRPRVIPVEWDFLAQTSGLIHKTHKTVVKRFHAMQVSAVLSEAGSEKFKYLIGPDRAPWEILTELSRFRDHKTMLLVATEICEHEMTAEDARLVCRRWRNGKTTSDHTDVLAKKIERVIRSYKLRHGDTTNQQVQLALCRVGEEFGEYEDAIYENEDESGDEVGYQEGTP